MSILAHRKNGLEALYIDLQRMAARTTAPGCTIDQIRSVLQDLGGRRYSRSEMALCLYWQQAEGHVDEWPCQAFLEQLRQLIGEEESSDSSYYGLYALNALLENPAFQRVLLQQKRKRTPTAKTVILSGEAPTGKSIAMQQLPARLSDCKALLVTLPQQQAPGRKITWRPFLLSMLAACEQKSTTHGPQALLEEVIHCINQYDLLILDQMERFSLQYLSDFCSLLRRCRCAVLLVGHPKFWDKVHDFDQDESFSTLVTDVEELDENDVWDCWQHGI